MSLRAFIIVLVPIVGVVALCATSFPGAMIGFLFAMGLLLLAIPVSALASTLTQAGIPATVEIVLWLLGGLYALFVLGALVQTSRLAMRGDSSEARVAGVPLAILIALPLMVWLSTKAMVHAWP